MLVLYEALLGLVSLVLVPFYALVSAFRGKRRAGIRERLGAYASEPRHHDVWIHAVSVGEAAAARTVVDRLREQRPELTLVMTTTTVTGQATARQLFPGATLAYYPFDFSFAVRRFLDHHSPRVYVTMETEIWPMVTALCRRRRIPMMMANGRISDRSYPRYRRFRSLVRRVLGQYHALLVREELDRERFIGIGAPPERVQVTGNVKFDFQPDETPLEFQAELQSLRESREVFIAGSTMEGEEEMLFPAFRRLIERNVLVIVAPRKPDRFDALGRQLDREGFACARRSRLGERRGRVDLLLLDSIGELARLYRFAFASFIGGSLVPTGGHNPIEPAAVGCPVTFGPHMSNFREIAAVLLASGAATEIRSADDLTAFAGRLLDEPQRQRELSRICTETIARNRGAASRTADQILELLG